MSDMQKADKLAVMGLRVILKIYSAHPSTLRVEAKDTLANHETRPYNIMTDTGGTSYEATFDDISLGDTLLSRLVDERIITGTRTNMSVQGAGIPPHIRRALTEQAGANSNMADLIREELVAFDRGEERPPGTFTRYAQDIGFQP